MRLSSALGALALAWAGCTSDAPAPSSASRDASPSDVDAPPGDDSTAHAEDPDVPPSGGEGREALPPAVINWSPCGSGLDCGRLRVPRDYARPADGSIELYVKRRRARGQRLGALLVNPGGPGASAADLVARFGQDNAELLERFDIVGFDPRGVGRSTPLDCHETLQRYVAADPSPDDDAEWRAIDRASAEFAQRCAERHAELLPHLGTPNVARDMDRVREALGDEQLNYVGFSYGTALGAWYAELFPQRVRTMVLDGAVDLTLSGVDLALEQGRSFDAALASYFRWCGASARNCSWTAGSAPAEAYARLEAAVDRQPLPSRRADRPAGPGELALGVITPLYAGEDGWATLSTALSAAVGGDGTLLIALADAYLERRDDGSYANIFEVNQAVNCLDHPVPESAVVRADAARFRAAAPLFGTPSLSALLICAHWPVKPEEPPAPSAEGAPPIVVIGTTGDPATPYAWAEALASELASGVLLTYDGEGHTAYDRGVTCIDDAVNAYLLSGTVPADGTRCGATRLRARTESAPSLLRWQMGR